MHWTPKENLIRVGTIKMPQRGLWSGGGGALHQNSKKVCCHACFSRAVVCCHWGWEEAVETAKTINHRNPPPPRYSGTEKQPKHKVLLGGRFLGHQGPRRRDIPDKNSMQVAFFWCFRQGVAGMSRDLGWDVPDLEKLYARKLWAHLSLPGYTPPSHDSEIARRSLR